MSSSRDLGDFFPVLSSKTRGGNSKKDTPKGNKFSSLNEAHRNITGKASKASLASGRDGSLASSAHPQSQFKEEFDHPVEPQEWFELSNLHAGKTAPKRTALQASCLSDEPQAPETPFNTPARLATNQRSYDAAFESDDEFDQTIIYSPAQAAEVRRAVEDAIHRTQAQLNLPRLCSHSHGSKAPEIPLPPLPTHARDAESKYARLYQNESVQSGEYTNTQKLLGTEESGPVLANRLSQTFDPTIAPSPLRLSSAKQFAQPAKGQASRRRRTFTTSSDDGGDSDSSDPDPFRFDRQSFAMFLNPTKEREVSRALRKVDVTSPTNSVAPNAGRSDGQASPEKVVGRRDHGRRDQYPTSQMAWRPDALNDIAEHGSIASSKPAEGTHRRPVVSGFYDAAAVNSDWEVQSSDVKIKVPSKHPQIKDVAAKTVVPSVSYTDAHPAPIAATVVQGGSRAGDDWEWETVQSQTTAAGRPSGLLLDGRHHRRLEVFKETGSSIADWTDADSVERGPQSFSASAGRVRSPYANESIVVHPRLGGSSVDQKYRVLKETNRGVLLPDHKLRGLNSGRALPALPELKQSKGGSLVRRLSDSFKSESKGRTQVGAKNGSREPVAENLFVSPTLRAVRTKYNSAEINLKPKAGKKPALPDEFVDIPLDHPSRKPHKGIRIPMALTSSPSTPSEAACNISRPPAAHPTTKTRRIYNGLAPAMLHSTWQKLDDEEGGPSIQMAELTPAGRARLNALGGGSDEAGPSTHPRAATNSAPSRLGPYDNPFADTAAASGSLTRFPSLDATSDQLRSYHWQSAMERGQIPHGVGLVPRDFDMSSRLGVHRRAMELVEGPYGNHVLREYAARSRSTTFSAEAVRRRDRLFWAHAASLAVPFAGLIGYIPIVKRLVWKSTQGETGRYKSWQKWVVDRGCLYWQLVLVVALVVVVAVVVVLAIVAPGVLRA